MSLQPSTRYRFADERGVALVTALFVTMLMSALLIGFTAAVTSDQKFRFVDRDRARAFYAAQSGLEKLTSELADLFFVQVTPTSGQIAALSNDPPVISGVEFESEGVAQPYGVTLRAPAPPSPIQTGPYQGLIAVKRVYDLDAAARTDAGGDVHLRRTIETVAIPVFQFGIFSNVNLSFSAADNFNFGGRVHTNSNLFLAEGSGGTLTLADRVTAVGQIVRQQLSNGVAITTSGSTGPVRVATAPGAYRALAATEGSVTNGPTSAANTAWPTISLSTYNGYLRTSLTGARRLDLPLLTTGGVEVDLVRRPAVNEDVTNPTLLEQRDFSRASLRILMSDTPNDITSLPGVTGTAPVRLDGDWAAVPPNNGTPYTGGIPIARSPGTTSVLTTAGVNFGAAVTIPVGATPDAFKIGAVVVTKGAVTYNLYCTGRNSTQLTGCTTTGASVSLPATVQGSYTTWDGAVITVGPFALTSSMTSSATTISVGSTNAPLFAPILQPRSFWVHNDPTGAMALVTCLGSTGTALTLCNVPDVAGASPDLISGARVTTAALSTQGTGTIGGYIKIELQDNAGAWSDVTMQMLNYGIAGPNLDGKACGDPTPNAIIRIQRLRDNNEPGAGACSYANSTRSTDYWPNSLFDTREGVFRDLTGTANKVRLGGVMYYVAIDVGNLRQWFAATGAYAGSPGPSAMLDNNGFSLYFSDRRNNRTLAGQETGEYGYEDVVNGGAAGTPNNTLDAGEDVNNNNQLDVYGQYPNYNGVANTVPPGVSAAANWRPTTDLRGSEAQVNRAMLFRHGLKLINGGLGNVPTPGFTVVSENPVYIQGDWNTNPALGFRPDDGHAATAVIADAVSLLSGAWNDTNSFASPWVTGGRPRTGASFYRIAVISGKGQVFPNPAGTGATFGTDGGAHSFLRFLEGGGGFMVNYMGSLVNFYYSRQAVSPFKCCGGVVYDVPQRTYSFDQEFLDMGRLPPLTPVFRDLNALGFSQELRPGQ